jgi:hypothetical protein
MLMNTTIFMDNDLENAFEQLSRLKINFHKSEIFCFGDAKNSEGVYSQLFGCHTRTYPFKYLGIPMHLKKLNNKDWKVVEQRIEQKLSSWKGKYLSVGGRLVLTNSVLSSMILFMLSFFEVPKRVLEKIDYYISRFFWKNDNHKKKYILSKWSILCQPKDQGGWGL